MIRFRTMFAVFATALVLAAAVAEADARQRGSVGSRGTRTYSAPPPTATAPNAATPMQRSVTQPGQPGQAANAARPAQQPAAGGMFSRPGLLGGLAAGFLGAGLLGLMFGQGLFGNLGGLAAFLGLALQIGLIALVGWFLLRLWRSRTQQPQPAYGSAGGPSSMRQSMEPPRGATAGPTGPMGLGGINLGGGAPQAMPAAAGGDEIGVQPADFDTFERLLGEVQTAYGRGDLAALRSRMTPEMLSYFSETLSADLSHGVEAQLTNVKLLQGDLAEAWREGDMEYATVAMRYELVDKLIWTFVRARGGNWLVSAIQQVEQ
jgi:predicted lipid-binding transport protein (Tim44 family)